MPLRSVGKSGGIVSAIGYGCMGLSEFRGPVDAGEGRLALLEALDRGITFFDTADMYGSGANEELVGSVLGTVRGSVVLATKCGIVRGAEGMRVDGSPAHIRAACEASLRRLKTDCVDGLYLHRVDPAVPIEESVGAMAQLVRLGHVRWLGLSKVDAAMVQRAERVHPIAAVQMEYSLWARDVEASLAGACRARDIAVVAYSPLNAGAKGTLEALQPHAAACRCTPAQLAIAWLLSRGAGVIPIPGMRTRAHVREAAGALCVTIPREVLDALDTPAPGLAQTT